MKVFRDQQGDISQESEKFRILEELKLHQVELEMQNDELQLVNGQLEIQQRKYAGVYDLAPIGFYILNKEGFVTEVNHIGISLLDSVRNKILSQQLHGFIAVEDRDKYHRFFRQLTNTFERQSCQLTMQTARGTMIHVQMEGIALKAADSLFQCNIVITDISRLKQTEDDLRLTKQRLEYSLQASSSGIWHMDLQSLNIQLDELILKSWFVNSDFDGKFSSFLSLIHQDDREGIDHYFRNAILYRKEIDVTCRFGEDMPLFYVRVRGHIKEQGTAQEHYTGIIMNVTENTMTEIRQQKVVAAATQEAEEKERRRISESLHDSVSQLLYAIRLKMTLIPGAEDQDQVLNEVYDLLDMAVVETRNVSFTLAPSILNDFGLPATLNELAVRLSSPQLAIKTNLSKFAGRVDKQLETVIFRIIQELVNNCLKHAHATEITIELRRSKYIYVTVTDNGCGFVPEHKEGAPDGSGLMSIKNRLVYYNGALQISSHPGDGTIVSVRLDENYI